MTSRTLKIKIDVAARSRKIIGRRAPVWDAAVGDVEATADTSEELVEHLALQLRALALHPAPMYRRLPDGRGLLIRITGALTAQDDRGVLTYALERFHPDGSTGGTTLSTFGGDGVSSPVSVDSPSQRIEGALRHVIEHELARYEAMERPAQARAGGAA